MTQVFLSFAAALVICIIVISLLIPLSKHFGWLDTPDERKRHETPTPAIGGFGMFLAVLLPMIWLEGFSQQNIGFLIGSLLLIVVGALDDKFTVDWKIRIAVQALAALSMIFISGVRAEHIGPLFGFGDIELGWISIPFTIFATLGIINALNMFDGLDGLLGTVGLFVICMIISAAVYSGSYDIAINLFIIMGALIGFLWFNLRFPWQSNARVFMGDAGSGFLGFILAYYIFKLTQDPIHPVSPILGPYLLALPIIDCLVLIVHRFRKGLSPFVADRDHGHYLMLDAGFSITEIIRTMVLLTCIFGIFGAAALKLQMPSSLLVMIFLFCLFAWFWITETRQRAIEFFSWLKKCLLKS